MHETMGIFSHPISKFQDFVKQIVDLWVIDALVFRSGIKF